MASAGGQEVRKQKWLPGRRSKRCCTGCRGETIWFEVCLAIFSVATNLHQVPDLLQYDSALEDNC